MTTISIKYISLSVGLMCAILAIFASAGTSHSIDLEAIEAARNKTFTIGIVKVTGCTPFRDDVRKKKIALERIPIADIGSTISKYYGIKVDVVDVDKRVRTVGERMYGQKNQAQPGVTIYRNCSNPYFGTKQYKKTGDAAWFTGKTNFIEGEDEGNTVFINYSFTTTEGLPWALKERIYYEVSVKADGRILLQHKGKVATFSLPKKGLIIDEDAVWDKFVFYAAELNKALLRDRNKAKSSERSSDKGYKKDTDDDDDDDDND